MQSIEIAQRFSHNGQISNLVLFILYHYYYSENRHMGLEKIKNVLKDWEIEIPITLENGRFGHISKEWAIDYQLKNALLDGVLNQSIQFDANENGDDVEFSITPKSQALFENLFSGKG